MVYRTARCPARPPVVQDDHLHLSMSREKGGTVIIYAITYKVTERSTFQAYVDAETEDQAIQELHEMARDNGGDYTAPGAWIATDDTVVDNDSFRVEVAEEPNI